MPPTKKAPKKAAKKAAKKRAGHDYDKHHQAKDLRRAYEHLGRVEVLRGNLESSSGDAIAELIKLAQQEIKDGHSKDAADLLRASEHLSFAFLAGDKAGVSRISAELQQSITEHFDELMRRADEHWEEKQHSGNLVALYQSSRKSASKSFKNGAFHRALEFARAAEALAHVKQHGPLKLESGRNNLQLKGN